MKNIFIILLTFLVAQTLSAHEHIEVGIDPADPNRLGFSGPGYQLTLYVPVGEPFSSYLPQFPGGYYASELTFSAEGNSIELANGARPKVELLSVSGPAGGNFSFWETGADSPTWTRPTGWSQTETGEEAPSLVVYEYPNGSGHIHGRAFTMDKPGTYEIIFRAVDETSLFLPSQPITVIFNAQPPPQLSIRLENDEAKLSFTSRLNLMYDLQVSTTLAPDSWTTIKEWIPGTGDTIELPDPINNRTRAFYRLVEYR